MRVRRSILTWLALPWLVLLLAMGELHAFSTQLVHSTEEFGKREVLTFKLPSEENKPFITLLDATTLRLTIPGLLSLPGKEIDFPNSRYMSGIQLEEIPGAEMGIRLTIALKEPFLNFRDFQKGDTYRLEIERYPVPMAMGPTRLLEGRALAGRDATLVVLSYTGHGWVEKQVDYGSHVVRLRWEGASVDQGWQEVAPEGLAEGVSLYSFTRNQVEMEIRLHKEVHEVYFYRNPESGSLVVELKQKGALGRRGEVEKIILDRKQAARENRPQPLNRLMPVFVNPPVKKLLNQTEVDEIYFYDRAREAEKERNFAKAMAYLESLVKVFPETQNRELIDLYMVDLGAKMEHRKVSHALGDLETALARQPNNHRYPHFRLLQLNLYNRTSQFENAASIMFDPNLPKQDPRVYLERGRTYMGLRRWVEAENQLKEVPPLDSRNAAYTAEAEYLLAKLAVERGDHGRAVEQLNAISRDHVNLLSNTPAWLMDMADIYFNNRFYDKSLNLYGMFLNYYPKDPELAPWAILRAAESRRRLGQVEAALHLYEQLLTEYPDSETAVWCRIYKLQLDTERSLEERLDELKKIVDSSPNTDTVVEAHITEAILMGDAGRNDDALDTLNKLLTLTLREEPVSRAIHLKHHYMVEGMVSALENQQPERAIMLGERYGSDWRKHPGFVDARIHLAEALLRLGIHHRAMPLLQGVEAPPAPELAELGKSFIADNVISLIQRGTGYVEISPEAARVRLDEAKRLALRKEWENILILLERLPPDLLVESERSERLRLLAKAEEGRGRFPQAVSNLEKLLFGKPLGEGMDYFWYASLLQLWKGDEKSMPAFQRVAKEAENPEVKALAHMRIGDVLQRGGDLNAAQKEYQDASKLIPGTAWAKLSKEIALQLEMVK